MYGRIYLCDLFSLSGFIPNGVADSIPSRVACAARFYLCVLFSSANLACVVNSCFPVDTEDPPAEISGFLHFPNRFVFVAVSACCELLYPSWVDCGSITQRFCDFFDISDLFCLLADLCFSASRSPANWFSSWISLVFPLEV